MFFCSVARPTHNKPRFLMEADGATRQRWRHALLRRAKPVPPTLGQASQAT